MFIFGLNDLFANFMFYFEQCSEPKGFQQQQQQHHCSTIFNVSISSYSSTTSKLYCTPVWYRGFLRIVCVQIDLSHALLYTSSYGQSFLSFENGKIANLRRCFLLMFILYIVFFFGVQHLCTKVNNDLKMRNDNGGSFVCVI